MQLYPIGTRIELNDLYERVGYLRSSCTNIRSGLQGTVIGYTADKSKYAIQFNKQFFKDVHVHQSPHDNGCHNKGPLHYCAYFPLTCVDMIKTPQKDEDLYPTVTRSHSEPISKYHHL